METCKLDAVLKQQDGSQLDRSRITSSGHTSLGGRRESSSIRNAESKEPEKDDQPANFKKESQNYDKEDVILKEMLNSLDVAFISCLPFDKMSSLEVECFSDLQGPSVILYIEIRNRIMNMWFQNRNKQLTEYAVKKIEALFNNDLGLVLRIHTFLEQHGFINSRMYERITPIPHTPSTDTQEIKQEPEETQLDVVKLSLDPEEACSLYEDHEIKEEMVIGPTEYYKPTFECSSAALPMKKPLINKEETNNQPTADNIVKVGQQNNPNIIMDHMSESKLPDISESVSKTAVSTKRKAKINKTANSPNPVKMRAENVNFCSDRDSDIVQCDRVNEYPCDICEYSTYDSKDLNSHLKAHAAARKFCCDMCPFITTQKRFIIVHLKAHSNNSCLICKTCNVPHVLKQSLDKHTDEKPYSCDLSREEIHKGKKPYSCDVCYKSFNRSDNLYKHHQRIHTGVKPFACDVCPKSFIEKSDLNRHKLIHTREKAFSCDVCQKSFNQKYYVNIHRLVHTSEKPYSCDVCQKSFRKKSYLNLHRQTHTGVKPFPCDVCLKSFYFKSTLRRHKRKHTSEKPYSCDVCQKSFSEKEYLDSHRQTHTGVKLFSCDMCHKRFNRKRTLVIHRRIHTGGTYSCNVCHKSFNQKYSLDTHRRRHTGVKPFSCDVCQKSFVAKDSLNKHRRIHTGVRPFSCDVCLKSFITKGNLNKHRRIHTDVKPFSCDVCLKSFIGKSELNIHRQIHTSEKPYSCDVCQKSFSVKKYLHKHQRKDKCGKPSSCDKFPKSKRIKLPQTDPAGESLPGAKPVPASADRIEPAPGCSSYSGGGNFAPQNAVSTKIRDPTDAGCLQGKHGDINLRNLTEGESNQKKNTGVKLSRRAQPAAQSSSHGREPSWEANAVRDWGCTDNGGRREVSGGINPTEEKPSLSHTNKQQNIKEETKMQAAEQSDIGTVVLIEGNRVMDAATTILVKRHLHSRLLREAMGQTAPGGNAPAFKGRPTEEEGALKYWCADQYTVSWMRSAISNVDLPSSQKLVLRYASEMTKRIRVGIVVPDVEELWESPTAIGQALAYQNSWACFERWLVLPSTQRQKGGWFVVASVPNDIVPAIMARDCRLVCGFGVVYVQFQGPGGKFYELPPSDNGAGTSGLQHTAAPKSQTAAEETAGLNKEQSLPSSPIPDVLERQMRE